MKHNKYLKTEGVHYFIINSGSVVPLCLDRSLTQKKKTLLEWVLG
jgi:hypothetical protein